MRKGSAAPFFWKLRGLHALQRRAEGIAYEVRAGFVGARGAAGGASGSGEEEPAELLEELEEPELLLETEEEAERAGEGARAAT